MITVNDVYLELKDLFDTAFPGLVDWEKYSTPENFLDYLWRIREIDKIINDFYFAFEVIVTGRTPYKLDTSNLTPKLKAKYEEMIEADKQKEIDRKARIQKLRDVVVDIPSTHSKPVFGGDDHWEGGGWGNSFHGNSTHHMFDD